MTCSICGGSGWLRRDLSLDHPQFGRAIPCQCKKAETEQAAKDHAKRVLQYSDLRGSMPDWTLDDFPGDPEACRVARQVIDERHGLYVFWSTYGTGKTGLLVAVVNACTNMGVSSLYISLPLLMEKLRHGYKDGTYDDLLNAVLDVPVLALDEFDRVYGLKRGVDDGTAQSWAAEKVFLLLDERYIKWNICATLVATNKPPDPGDSDPITSRFGDSLRSHIVHVKGQDLRPDAARYERHTP